MYKCYMQGVMLQQLRVEVSDFVVLKLKVWMKNVSDQQQKSVGHISPTEMRRDVWQPIYIWIPGSDFCVCVTSESEGAPRRRIPSGKTRCCVFRMVLDVLQDLNSEGIHCVWSSVKSCDLWKLWFRSCLHLSQAAFENRVESSSPKSRPKPRCWL